MIINLKELRNSVRKYEIKRNNEIEEIKRRKEKVEMLKRYGK